MAAIASRAAKRKLAALKELLECSPGEVLLVPHLNWRAILRVIP
jgi:hypothetical protein